MIRNVVIHISNEQPLIADLFGVPMATDAGLLCMNLRMTDGKRPVFIDNTAATFFFPYLHIRFLEIPPGALAKHIEEGGEAPSMTRPGSGTPGADKAGSRLPVPVGGTDDEPEEELDVDVDLDIDEGFLQRVRDI